MASPAASSVISIEIERKGETALVKLRGRLIAGVNGLVYSQVRPLIPEAKRIVLDLAEVTQMDSMGLGALVRLYVSAKNAGCSLELMHIGKRIRELLGITHLLEIFTIVGERGITFRF
ncbi:MAG TPA: STAS domain-containing protein [Acidobacteriaceae bacterium]|nr:STAS domain-containing protein [Acidobacteriaceae bacterium]